MEAYRRYPAPELLHLPVHSGVLAAQLTPATSPDVPDAPRNRSSGATTTPSSTTTTATTNSGDEGVREENKTVGYKTVPTATNREEDEEEHSSTGDGPSHASSSSISLRLRWGFEAADLRRVYALHEDALPLSYGPSYYEWLLDHDSCIALVATVTKDTYARCVEAASSSTQDGVSSEKADAPLAWFPGYTPASAEEAAAGPRPVPPPASQRRLTTEVMAEHADVDRCLTELEYVAQRTQKAAGTSRVDASIDEGRDDAAYTEVVGFILGQCAYARHDAGHLLTNPTSYIGSFIVEPRLQRCGLGSALLQRFLHYVTELRPVYAQDYLHYDERKLIAMLAAAQLRKRSELSSKAAESSPAATSTDAAGSSSSKEVKTDAAVSTASASTAASTLSSALYQVVAAYLPEAMVWWEDRTARQRLRARGLSEAEVDAQRFRERLAPDALTDEEADEVRRDAKHFVVQTGVREVWLHCLPGNVKANALYAHRSFTLHRVLRGYYDVDGEKYDANLLLYTRPVAAGAAEAVKATETPTSPTNADPNATEAAGAAAAALAEMDTVVRRHDTQAQTPLDAAAAAALGTGEGLRRRRTAAEANHAEDGAADTHPSPPTAAAAAARERRSLSGASWLSPRTYPVVADVILCTAADGQEEWQRRFGGSGDVTGRRSWWETVREAFFVVNALGLLCAVLWLAYNVGLTGKVE